MMNERNISFSVRSRWKARYTERERNSQEFLCRESTCGLEDLVQHKLPIRKRLRRLSCMINGKRHSVLVKLHGRINIVRDCNAFTESTGSIHARLTGRQEENHKRFQMNDCRLSS
eukprot:930531-Prorocentrum_minimum.AAC.3